MSVVVAQFTKVGFINSFPELPLCKKLYIYPKKKGIEIDAKPYFFKC